MVKKFSLRTRLTLLSTLVTTSMAILLTWIFMFNADRIFVQELPIIFSTTVENENYSLDATAPMQATSVDTSDFYDDNINYMNAMNMELTLTQANRQFNIWGFIGLFIITLLGAAAAWIMAGRALKPVRELSKTIEEVNSNNLSIHVDTGGREDEVGQLGSSFNAMMDKVSSSFERQKRFSANAAHELKTPLASIQVGLEVLELDEQPTLAQMEWALAITKTNTERMIQLVEDLFTLSSDKECEMNDCIDIKAIFSQISEELADLIHNKNLKLTIDINETIQIDGNASMLYRAFFNLVENAVKYNKENGTIRLTASKESDAVKVCITDSGIGISKNDLEHIFEPFYRADQSRSRKMGGSGLGLSLVYDIMVRHNAQISVESQLDKGTSFTLLFNMAKNNLNQSNIENNNAGDTL